jgi:dephospho-CoA kinase
MAGGAGSGKGFAINNFIDAAGFKVRDVDEMKTAVAKLDKLGKFSIDAWYKKYGNKLSDKPGKNGELSPKAHIEEFVLGKGMSISLILQM